MGYKRREFAQHCAACRSSCRVLPAAGGSPSGWNSAATKQKSRAWSTAVNDLLTTRRRAAREQDTAQAPRLFADLGEPHFTKRCWLHREVILYANRQFASFVGVDRVDLVGRRLARSGAARNTPSW